MSIQDEAKPEAAPSDTDLQAAADRLEAALDPDKRGGWTRLQDGDDGHSEIDDLRVVLAAARTSQPVQVEVTDDKIATVAKFIAEAVKNADLPGFDAFHIARAALSAALGGGDQ